MPLGSQGAGLGAGSLGAGASNVRFATVARGLDGPSAPGFFVLNNPVVWDNYWRTNHQGPAPTLEANFFGSWRLVAIHLGDRPSGGYAVNVASMIRSYDRLTMATIRAIETVPPRGVRTDAGATSPWVLLRVEQGAFGLTLQTLKSSGFATGVTTMSGGTTVIKSGGATVIIGGGGDGGGCDHCDHCGRGTCHCARGARGCDCRGR